MMSNGSGQGASWEPIAIAEGSVFVSASDRCKRPTPEKHNPGAFLVADLIQICIDFLGF